MPDRTRNDREFQKLLKKAAAHAHVEGHRSVVVTLDQVASYLVIPQPGGGFDVSPMQRTDGAQPGWSIPDLADESAGGRDASAIDINNPLIQKAESYLRSAGLSSISLTAHNQLSHLIVRGPDGQTGYCQVDLEVDSGAGVEQ